MNNREVIEWLRKKAETVPMPGARKMYEAAAKAISCTHENDLISRQAAIDALKEKVFSNLTDEFYGAMQVLDELPSAQPEQRWIPVTKEEVFKAGYEGREIRFRVDGRLFAIRELAQ